MFVCPTSFPPFFGVLVAGQEVMELSRVEETFRVI